MQYIFAVTSGSPSSFFVYVWTKAGITLVKKRSRVKLINVKPYLFEPNMKQSLIKGRIQLCFQSLSVSTWYLKMDPDQTIETKQKHGKTVHKKATE
mgnify:CR=1 FL=1